MAATITDEIVSTAPGATCTVDGTGLSAGEGASLSLAGQGADGTQSLVLTGTFTGASVTFRCPDGARDGLLTVTASDASTATVPVRVNSQYVFSAEFMGTGDDTSALATGELDAILQRASAYADAYLCQGGDSNMTLRQLQTIEQHRWRKSRRVYPRRSPIATVDDFQYIASPSLKVSFDPTTFVVVPDLNYIELVIWSLGYSYITAVADATMFDAGICVLTYTAGYTWATYPPQLRQAVTMIASELLSQRSIQSSGMGGLARVKTGTVIYDRRNEPFAIPEPAMTLLDSMRRSRAA